MAIYAVISGDTVSNTIVADSKEDAEQALHCTLVEITDKNPAGIGWQYDIGTNSFIPPVLQEFVESAE